MSEWDFDGWELGEFGVKVDLLTPNFWQEGVCWAVKSSDHVCGCHFPEWMFFLWCPYPVWELCVSFRWDSVSYKANLKEGDENVFITLWHLLKIYEKHDHHFPFLPPSWRHAHAHFGFAHRQQPLRWLKPFLKHWYVKLYELIAPHTLKWINSVIKLGHFVWNIIYCLSRIKFKDRWVLFFIYDSFCWTKSPTAASLGSRNDAM